MNCEDRMNRNQIQDLMRDAASCARAMLENAEYILRELPSLMVNAALEAKVRDACESLTSTKHDIFTELFELDELLSDPATLDAQLGARTERIVRWLSEPLTELHNAVTLANAQASRDANAISAFALVAGSAVNVLNEFAKVRSSAEQLESQRHCARSQSD